MLTVDATAAGEVTYRFDPSRPEANAARLPNARVVQLADCAHIIPWEKPTELLDAVSGFLRD